MSCKVTWCDLESLFKGFCNKHYLQNKRHGKVFITGRDVRKAVTDKTGTYLQVGVGGKDGRAYIDAEFAYLERHKWSLSHGYAVAMIDGKRAALHRLVLGSPVGEDVDHINGDRLDNRKNNLRICSRAQNNFNRGLTDKNRTGYKGVYYHKAAKKFAARIQFMRKSYHLGLFNSKLDAADAYDKAAYKYFGEFARLNRVN